MQKGVMRNQYNLRKHTISESEAHACTDVLVVCYFVQAFFEALRGIRS